MVQMMVRSKGRSKVPPMEDETVQMMALPKEEENEMAQMMAPPMEEETVQMKEDDPSYSYSDSGVGVGVASDFQELL